MPFSMSHPQSLCFHSLSSPHAAFQLNRFNGRNHLRIERCSLALQQIPKVPHCLPSSDSFQFTKRCSNDGVLQQPNILTHSIHTRLRLLKVDFWGRRNMCLRRSPRLGFVMTKGFALREA
jgi:hypothetical protein